MMPRIAILIALWYGLLDAVSATRARWRADAARTWPLPGDVWRMRCGWEVVVVSLDAPPLVGPGVTFTLDGQTRWVERFRWSRYTAGMRLAKRGGAR